MSFDWNEFYSLASNLYNQPLNLGTEPASYRSAISRSYYAAFCCARNFLLNNGEITLAGKSSVHGQVRDAYINSSDKIRTKIGNRLNVLRRRRNNADYDDNFKQLEKETKLSLTLSQRIIDGINQI